MMISEPFYILLTVSEVYRTPAEMSLLKSALCFLL